jgi:hypothetical protein
LASENSNEIMLKYFYSEELREEYGGRIDH